MTLEKRQQHRNGEGKKKRQHRNGTKKAGRNIIGTAEPMDKVRWQNSQTEVSERRKKQQHRNKTRRPQNTIRGWGLSVCDYVLRYE